jgi:hypothetical protein
MESIAAALGLGGRIVIFGEEKMQFFRHRAGAHVRFENFCHRSQVIPSLFLALPTDRLFRLFILQEPGAGLNEHPIRATVYKCGESKLSGEKNGLLFSVKKKNRGSVSSIVCFTADGLPGSIFPPEVESGLLEGVPIVGEHLDFLHPDFVFHDFYDSSFEISDMAE